MRIALDAMGSDAAPSSEVEGALTALAEDTDLGVVLLGLREALEPFKKKIGEAQGLALVEVEEAIGMHEAPSEALKTKAYSSIARGIDLLKRGEVDAFVSAGNTGAVMAFSLFTLGRIKGIQRPALGASFPTPSGHTFVLDVGANVEAKPVQLRNYAVMGRIVMEKIFRVPQPRVGVINVGHERGKGNQLTQEAYGLLEQAPIRFIGNLEGSEVFRDKADVIVTDGFTGNVLLKVCEGMGEAVLSTLHTTGKKYRWRSWFSKKVFRDFISGLNYEESGGAILLGVEGSVIISHGRSSAHAITNALRLASFTVREGVVDAIKEEFSN
ncbi:phosphate--acyl-ACP acyltransferase [candidate division TA06 bacterium B3_TA06]|uniref:Phosphate acyltransferase n=1 Tax=candidate division TA06 bacterium B3_TA06 TaxID=2012487 RepID=A0A532V916_UNCT6|nr:MAG: phosphate--acyl-ACP acyltransferase [candidate division TA06 bacterium B3_TA06]